MDLDAILARRPAARARRRARPLQCARQPPPQALPGCRGTARRRHRRLTTLNVQHVESLNDVVARITHVRVRETVPDARPRPGRRYRGDRPAARRADPAAQGRQGLRPADGAAGARPLFLARQPDGAARAGPAPDGPAGRRAVVDAHAGPRHRRALAGRRPPAGLRQRRPQGFGDRPLRAARRRAAARTVGRPLRRDAARAASLRSRARLGRRGAAAGVASRRRDGDAARPRHCRRDRPLRRGQQFHPHRHRPAETPALARAAAGLADLRPDPNNMSAPVWWRWCTFRTDRRLG